MGGLITQDWQVFAGYAYLDSEFTRRGAAVGLEVQGEGLQVEVQFLILEVDLVLVSLTGSFLTHLIPFLSARRLHLWRHGSS